VIARSDRRIAVGLFAVVFVTYAWFFAGGGWNQNAHFDLARALVERQTLHIDGYRQNTGDISWSPVGGIWRPYINKAPGASFLAAVPYFFVYHIERALHVPIDSWKWMTINAWIVTALTCGVCGALIPVVLYRWGRKRDVSPLRAVLVSLTIAFGTIVFPFSTTLFAQVPAALFLLLAFAYVGERPLLAGVFAGIAGWCFYVCIPAAVVLAFFAGRKRILRYIAGGAPFAILLGAYHNACFGSPFRTSVQLSTGFTEPGLLFGVFRIPTVEALWGLTFSEYRGLFIVSPVLLLALFPWRKGRELAMAATLILVTLLVVASFNQWSGGFAFGSRYLLPVIPLFAIPLFWIRGRAWIAIAVVLAILSCGQQFIATSVDPTPDSGIRQPMRKYLWPAFRAGKTSINEQTVDELIPHFLYKPGSHESQWAAANLGEVLRGKPGIASVIPIALWMLIAGAMLVRRAGVSPAGPQASRLR
jgi:hypothetical protein